MGYTTQILMPNNHSSPSGSAAAITPRLKMLRCSCEAKKYTRRQRTFWMRLIPGLRLYSCASCDCNVLAPKGSGRQYPYPVAIPCSRGSFVSRQVGAAQPAVFFQGEAFNMFVTRLLAEVRQSTAAPERKVI